MLAMRDPADNDPHDVLEITPDVVLVARAEQELSRLARETKSRSGQQADPPASPANIQPRRSPSSLKLHDDVPQVDASFRAAVTDGSPTIAQRIGRAFLGVLLAICIGGAALVWRSSGAVVTQTIAALGPGWASSWLAARSSPPAEASAPAAQNATAAAATPASQDAAAPAAAQDATASAAAPATPKPDTTQMLQSMSHDLAGLNDEITQLKSDIAGLKASQDQMSRDMAKVAEQNQRLRQARAAMPPARKPPPLRPAQAATPAAYPAQASSYPPPSQASAYPPPQAPYPPPSAYPPPSSAYPPPQTAYAPPPRSLQPPGDPDAPRPPMPVQ
jgi:hypothetical protein